MTKPEQEPETATLPARMDDSKLPGSFVEGRDVARRREQREATGLEDVTPGALQRLDEIARARFSLQSMAGGTVRLVTDGARHLVRPVMPGKAPSNTMMARVLRRVALRGKGGGIYNTEGQVLYSGTSDNLLKMAHQQGVDMARLDAWGVHLDRMSLRSAKLEQADFRQSRMSGVDFHRAKLDGAKFTRAKITGTVERVQYRQYKGIEAANFSCASLKGADFRKARLAAVSFVQADLQGADFTGAKFGGMSCFESKTDVAKGVAATVTVIPALFLLDDREYWNRFDRSRAGMSFRDANLEGAKFSIDAPFGKLGLSKSQRDSIVLVDRRGNLRPDLGIEEDGSVFVKAVLEKTKAAQQETTQSQMAQSRAAQSQLRGTGAESAPSSAPQVTQPSARM
ncbi:MAG: hypothetical protein Alpg2KO_06990 [Alphaproteobacteria bacterium]